MPNKEGRAMMPRTRDSRVITIRVPRDLYERLEQLAAADERSTAWMTRRLLQRALGEWERRP